ncbi:Mss4-like protein [Collybia nuda]|uniref:Mss4-like protein n=1 Tax=Collybia nuda TaxID=64659 RepID=A0A9P5YC48_9AGAR|nr:Mss4-like protein [Collybia nuda]
MIHHGSCYCKEIQYDIDLASSEEARTSLCHCKNCKKWTGSAFGITTKIPRSALSITHGRTVEHISDNGSGTKLYREFCGTCGSGILEYGENAGDSTYITYGSLDSPEELPPKGEFFCKFKDQWLPNIPGE